MSDGRDQGEEVRLGAGSGTERVKMMEKGKARMGAGPRSYRGLDAAFDTHA